MRSVPVVRRRAERLPVDRYQTLAYLAGRLGEQLLEPCAEVANAGRRDDCDFVSSAVREHSEDRAQHHAGVFSRRDVRAARVDHFLRGAKKACDVETHDRGGDHPEG